MPIIPLTRGYIAKVSAVDFKWLSQFNWWTSIRRGRPYAQRHVPETGKKTTMHQMVAIAMGLDPEQVDHKDDDSLNNQRGNLLAASQSQNRANVKRYRNNRSGFKGVCRRGSRWIAYIQKENTWYYLGRFATSERAAKAYDRAAIRFFGRFARLNFPCAR